MREVLEDGVDGLLVNESDPVAMADALERLLRSPGQAAAMAANARRVALGWTPRYPSLDTIVAHAWACEQRIAAERG